MVFGAQRHEGSVISKPGLSSVSGWLDRLGDSFSSCDLLEALISIM